MKKEYIIPSNPVAFYGLIVGIIISGTMALLDMDLPRHLAPHLAPSWFTCIVGVAAIFATTRSYVLDKNGLEVKLFCWTVRFVLWRRIKQIVLLREAGEYVFLMTLDECELFDERKYSAARYAKRFREKVIAISVSKKKLEETKEAFERFYGPLRCLNENK